MSAHALPRHSPWFSPVEEMVPFLPTRMRFSFDTARGRFDLFDKLTVVVRGGKVFVRILSKESSSGVPAREVQIRYGRWDYGVPYFLVSEQGVPDKEALVREVITPTRPSGYFGSHQKKMRTTAEEIYRDNASIRHAYEKIVRDYWATRVGQKYETRHSVVQIVESDRYKIVVKNCDTDDQPWIPVTWIDEESGEMKMAARGSADCCCDFPIMLTPISVSITQ